MRWIIIIAPGLFLIACGGQGLSPDPSPMPIATPLAIATATPTSAPATIISPEPTPPAPPVVALPATAPGACPSVQVVTVADPVLVGATQQGIDLLTEALGCIPFVIGEGETLIAFHDFAESWYSLRLVATAALYPDGRWEIWINPVCWPLVAGWPETIAHELGHLLGWRDMDGHPYMAATSPPGAKFGPDAIIEC